ncbi:putative bifunctional diguanylate cyclase/phosphodiesterase [Erythrobacter litoralis]|uniref:Sensory box/GGDEF family protein n=1 Tax=Erythrobacter litoralis (strain HTCC2594) TaxID=314225 RepID=Q2NCL2_ERYLH|nr:GGDEF and EAL domain-containing protein [Erythrobacter litoralis]ABC62579.1 sensory box/GGDEF family protein [Erythrobacter litoralis HTCC2594]
MSENRSDALSLPATLPLLAILGIKECDSADWPRLRALQYARVAQHTRFRLGAHFACAAISCWISLQHLAWLTVLGWAIGLALTLSIFTSQDWLLRKADGRTLSQREAFRHASGSALVAIAWAAQPVLHWLYGTPTSMLQAWLIVMVVTLGSSLALAAAPLGAIIYIATTSMTAIVVFGLAGQYPPAVAALLYMLVILWGVYQRAEAFLRQSAAEAGMNERNEVVSLLLREFEENEADWLWQIDTQRKVRSVSPRFAFALGLEPGEADGMPFLQLIAGDAWKTGQFPTSLHDLAERLKRKESFSNLLVKVSIDGVTRWWELSGTPMLDEEGKYVGYRGVGSDVTEQRESSEKIAYLARYDTLTELPNRLMVNESLGEAMKYAKQWRSRCAFMMIDLDRFKAVNDSLGHQTGDELLAEVSGRLKSILSENEMCGRLGGDEFAIVIRDVKDRDYVDTVARRVIEHLSQPYEVNHHMLYVGASVGSAIAPRDGRSVEELMRNADLALYRAKDLGGGEHFQYEPSLHKSAEERRQLEFSLRMALDRQEFELAYQPVVDANDETIISFEALLRWNSAEHGFVSPAKFIPLAEDTRLIVPIGSWVLEQACIEAANWPDPVKVNVNVSPEQLVEPDFVATVVRALSTSGLPANRLELEVTESIFVRDALVAGKALKEVMHLGCQVALDDFGTGYSSLGYLRQLSFSTIKVDRMFVQGAAQGSKESLAIIRAVVAMADSLDMTTTAEGVESFEEAELIRELGCTKIQGYYFGRPMVKAEARKLFDVPGRLRA